MEKVIYFLGTVIIAVIACIIFAFIFNQIKIIPEWYKGYLTGMFVLAIILAIMDLYD